MLRFRSKFLFYIPIIAAKNVNLNVVFNEAVTDVVYSEVFGPEVLADH